MTGAGRSDHRGRRRDPDDLRGGAAAGGHQGGRRGAAAGPDAGARADAAGLGRRRCGCRPRGSRTSGWSTSTRGWSWRPPSRSSSRTRSSSTAARCSSPRPSSALVNAGHLGAARPQTPTDKAIVEATFGVHQDAVLPARRRLHRLEHHAARPRHRSRALDAARVAGPARRVGDRGGSRPHDSAPRPAGFRGGRVAEREYAALVAAAGYLPLTLTGEDYLELLPVNWRADQRLRHPDRLPHLRLLPSWAARGASRPGWRASGGCGKCTMTPTTGAGVRPHHQTALDHRRMDASADGCRPVRRLHLAARPPLVAESGRDVTRNRDRPRVGQPAHPRRARPGHRKPQDRRAHPRRAAALGTDTEPTPRPEPANPPTADSRPDTAEAIPFGVFDADAEAERWI